MDRLARIDHGAADDADAWARLLYQRTMAGWVCDLLRRQGGAAWPKHDPLADYRDRDWRRLYQGSILDD